MTALKVDYTTGGDPRDNMSEDELAAIRVLELDKLRREVAQQQIGQKDFDEALHPRDDHGRFTDGGGSDSSSSATTPTPKPGEQISLPHTTAEVHALYLKGLNSYKAELQAHGGPANLGFSNNDDPESVVQNMNVDQARPEDVTPEQRAVCEEAAAKFLDNPDMQPLFDAYGKPEIVVASGLITPDAGDAGDDPRAQGVVAQWSNGTIIMYGDTAGDPENNPSVPGFSEAGTDPNLALIHEYGHQIMGVLGYDSSGSASDFRNEFVKALSGIRLDGAYTDQQISEAQDNVNVNAGQFSEYATSSPDEAFAEAFLSLYDLKQSGGSIDESYDDGAAAALHLIENRITADTNNSSQQTLFSRSTP